MARPLRSLTLLTVVLSLCTACSSSDEDGSGDDGANGSDAGAPGGGGDAGAPGGGGDAEPDAMKGITAAHNAARASADVTIPPLSWSSEVAAAAQAHAARCVFEHSGANYGENIFATTAAATPDDVVGQWISEEADYDYANNDCSDTCGHYTQVVWAKSLRLGCGMFACAQGSPFSSSSDWQLWVCNYDPPGNYVGERPY